MRQEVKINVLLTYDVAASLSREDILSQIRIDIARLMDPDSESKVELVQAEFGTLYDDAVQTLIETQAREIERLRGALEQIAQADYGYTDIIESGAPPEKHADYFCSMVTWRQRTARAALAGDSHDQ